MDQYITESLHTTILKEIRFETLVKKSCQDCKFHEEKSSLHVDREWYSVCNLLKDQLGIFTLATPSKTKCDKWCVKEVK